MTKFKVGDRVECVDTGRTGEVVKVHHDGRLVVRLDRSHQLVQTGGGGFKAIKEAKP